MNILVNAENAPKQNRPGAGVVLWTDGKLTGDSHLIDAAKQVTTVRPTPHDSYQPVDWGNPQHARTVLGQVMVEAYGQPVSFTEDEDEPSGPTIEQGSAKAASTI